VPADFVAHARLPLTIDPVLSTFSIDTNPPNAFGPNYAFDVREQLLARPRGSVQRHRPDVVWRRLRR
jgi:hypothetical protein